MISIKSFFSKAKVDFIRMSYGWIVKYNNVRALYLIRIATGNYVAVKNVNITTHGGLGQYLIYHRKVATAKDVIDEVEKKFGEMLVAFAVRFYDYKKLLGVVIYDYDYYRQNRRMIQYEGYELQYSIDLPELIEEFIRKAKNMDRYYFRIVIDKDGKSSEEWVLE